MEVNPHQNRLLNALPPNDFARVEHKLEPFRFTAGEIVYAAGDEITFGMFPVSGLISRLHRTEEGETIESGMAGRNGFVGLGLIMGGDIMPNDAVAQVTGGGFKIAAADLKAEFFNAGIFQTTLLRYTQITLSQIAQYAVCNRLHTVEEQLGRWLLAANDELTDREIPLTHEMIGNLLGVRREGISVAARNLQDQGFIRYSRGSITVLDAEGLEDYGCECHRLVRDEYRRLLG